MKLGLVVLAAAVLAGVSATAGVHRWRAAQAKVAAMDKSLPSWVRRSIESQPWPGGDTIEEDSYQGRSVFEVLPRDRAFDSGNEHVLHADDGRIICEFGGFAGHVTVGRCDLGSIVYMRTLYTRRGNGS